MRFFSRRNILIAFGFLIVVIAATVGAIVSYLKSPEFEARAREYLGFGGLNNDDSVGVAITSVPVSLGGTDTAQASKVTITYPFTFMVLQPIAQLVVAGAVTGEPITLTAVSTMRNESQF